ncbi:MAG: radical SAM protein [Candidatus Nealsonbacteria bacterium]|nr:MAG: radical SAM protein [Candidatus Nealsonbacteria bacterium]
MPWKKIKKTVIFTGYRCNNRCRFCMEANKRNLPVRTTLQVQQEMTDARKRGSDYLELIGGEMTIRTDIVRLIKFAKDLGFSTIMMSSNGRMYSYPDLAESILKAGLNSLVFSIHGHTPKLHDWLTRVPGSFNQLKQGVKNVQKISKKLGLNIHIGSNTTIVKQNYRFLPRIGEYIRRLGIDDSEFIFVDCNEGAACDYFAELVPRISEIADYVHKCLDIGKRAHLQHWHVRYVPLCYFQDYLDQISELQEVATFRTEHVAPDFYSPDVEENRRVIGRMKTKKCKGCKLYDKCEGIWKIYLQRYGDKELRPVKDLSIKQLKILSSY